MFAFRFENQNTTVDNTKLIFIQCEKTNLNALKTNKIALKYDKTAERKSSFW